MRETFTATLLRLNEVNLNGRIYRDNENLRESIKDFNDRQKKMGVAYGELGYPDTFDTNLGNVSHCIKNVRIEGDNVVGDIRVLDTEKGNILQEKLNEMVIRPRAAGNTNADGTVNISRVYSFDAIPKDEDSFNPNNAERFREYKAKYDKNYKVYGKIVSDLDPYGEEHWEE